MSTAIVQTCDRCKKEYDPRKNNSQGTPTSPAALAYNNTILWSSDLCTACSVVLKNWFVNTFMQNKI